MAVLSRIVNNLLVKRGISTSALRRGESNWAYRAPCKPPPRINYILADVFGTFTWWWIFYHLFTDYKHLTGEFPFPDSNTWTDAELGIPLDDEE